MCGILGFTGEPDHALLRRMARSLRHRGHDAQGFFEDSSVSLGCQRLRIRDPSPEADQPFIDPQGRCIVFNGEIFNDELLRRRLEAAGRLFRTDCDTETVLASYALWGPACFTQLDGMFAAAIWDPLRRSLVLSRDPHGIKPLYYTVTPAGSLFFSSELKALLMIPGLERTLNRDALAAYLTFGCNPLDESLITGIRRAPPGHVMIRETGGSIRLTAFPPEAPPAAAPSDDALFAVLSRAVGAATHDLDGPGLFLSGGVDSSLLLALMAESGNPPGDILTYTAAFPSYDESQAARRVAEHFGTEHTTVHVEEPHLGLLPEIMWYADEALSDPTAIPMFLLARAASRDVRVVLTGDGADELFYGYEQTRFLYLRRRLFAPLPPPVRRALAGALPSVPLKALARLFPYAEDLGEQGIARAQRFLREDRPLHQYLAMVSHFDEGERSSFWCGPGPDAGGLPMRLAQGGGSTGIDSLSRLDSSILLTYGMLPKTDRMTMAHGVEARPPYLSAAVCSASRSIPLQKKVGLFSDKICLRRVARKVLPREMVGVRKHRFFVPIHTMWQDCLVERFRDACDSPAMRLSGLDGAAIARLADDVPRSPLYYSRQMWNILSLLLWMEMFISHDGRKVRRPAWW